LERGERDKGTPTPRGEIMVYCDGISCQGIRAIKPTLGGRYEIGQKYCPICCVFVEWEGVFCPCCHYLLRTKPRNSQNRARLVQILKLAV